MQNLKQQVAASRALLESESSSHWKWYLSALGSGAPFWCERQWLNLHFKSPFPPENENEKQEAAHV